MLDNCLTLLYNDSTMAKEDFIGIRVSKEFKEHLQREAKRKRVSLATYIQEHFEDNFRDVRSVNNLLIENAKDERPEYWKQGENNPLLGILEKFAETYPADFLNPMGIGKTDIDFHIVFMLGLIAHATREAVSYFDSIKEDRKKDAAGKFFYMAEAIAENLNKFKSKDKDTQLFIISEIRNLIELLSFHFTSQAFAKDSFLTIKTELDKTEKALRVEIENGK